MSQIVLVSDTLLTSPAVGTIEYNGQFYGTDSNSARAQMQRITQGTAVASTSGASIDFTGIPAWVKRITVMFNGVSTTSTSLIQVQGGSGSIDSASYTSVGTYLATSTLVTGSAVTSGFITQNSNLASATNSGIFVMTNVSGNIWVASSSLARSDGATNIGNGTKTFSGTLDRIRITTTGADTFDAGSINILYEG